MALRHLIPSFEPSLQAPLGSGVPLSRFKAPVQVGFRNGADLKDVVNAVRDTTRVSVDAAVGAGKSTRLPSVLAAELSLLVVQVFPNEYLASDIADYCRSQGQDVVFVEKPSEEFPIAGVACISAPCLVAKWLAAGMVVLPPCVLFHDESHESDAYTYLVKNLASSSEQLQCYVSATATKDVAGFRAMETEGQVVTKLYPDTPSDRWDLYGEGPWAVQSFTGNVLIYEDDRAKAERLMHEYNAAGVIAFRLHSRMPLKEFREAMRRVRDPRSPIVVLIADYAFRSGFTFLIERIIDTGVVINIVVEDGMPVRIMRAAYGLERYQGSGRGGRIPGLVTQYYAPSSDAPAMICELEVVEIEAAVLVLRLLGFQVPRHIERAAMAQGTVPRNLVQALRGENPLSLVQATQKIPLEQFFQPSGRRSPYLREGVGMDRRPYDFVDTRISADTARRVGAAGMRDYAREEEERHVREVERNAGRVALPTGAEAPNWPNPLEVRKSTGAADYTGQFTEVVDTISALAMHVDTVESLVVGNYYYPTGNYTSDTTCAAFPDGADSVCRWFAADKSRSHHLGLTDYARGVALNALAVRYNLRTCELRILSKAIPAAKTKAAGKDLGSLRQWARDMSERLSKLVAETKVLSMYLESLAEDFCGLAMAPPMTEHEESGYRQVLAGVQALPDNNLGMPTSLLQDFRSQWAAVPIAGGVVASVSDSSEEAVRLDTIPMPVHGKGMRAVRHSHTRKSSGGGGGHGVNGFLKFVTGADSVDPRSGLMRRKS